MLIAHATVIDLLIQNVLVIQNSCVECTSFHIGSTSREEKLEAFLRSAQGHDPLSVQGQLKQFTVVDF